MSTPEPDGGDGPRDGLPSWAITTFIVVTVVVLAAGLCVFLLFAGG